MFEKIIKEIDKAIAESINAVENSINEVCEGVVFFARKNIMLEMIKYLDDDLSKIPEEFYKEYVHSFFPVTENKMIYSDKKIKHQLFIDMHSYYENYDKKNMNVLKKDFFQKLIDWYLEERKNDDLEIVWEDVKEWGKDDINK